MAPPRRRRARLRSELLLSDVPRLEWWLERTGRWQFGYEQPFTPVELRRAGALAGAVDLEIIGSSAIGDALRFATPMVAAKLSRGRVRPPEVELGSPLDRYLGYALTLVATKP